MRAVGECFDGILDGFETVGEKTRRDREAQENQWRRLGPRDRYALGYYRKPTRSLLRPVHRDPRLPERLCRPSQPSKFPAHLRACMRHERGGQPSPSSRIRSEFEVAHEKDSRSAAYPT